MEKIEFKIDKQSIQIDFGEEIDLDIDILTDIDLNNIIGEIVNFSKTLAKVGIYLAISERKLNAANTAYEVNKADFKRKLRDKPSPNISATGNDKGWTVDQTEDQWRSSPNYKVLKERVNNLTFHRDVMNALYWALKDKGDKLQKLSMLVTREDLEQ